MVNSILVTSFLQEQMAINQANSIRATYGYVTYAKVDTLISYEMQDPLRGHVKVNSWLAIT